MLFHKYIASDGSAEGNRRWCKDWGLANIGFGREKTTYCYFAVAAATTNSFPHESPLRTMISKTAILVTVADDFFDTKGSLEELETLTQALLRLIHGRTH